MKKMKRLSLFLCLVILLQCVLLPVSAAETAEEQSEETTQATAAVETKAAFGTFCVSQGCRTIEGQVALGGSDRKLETASAAFVYEMETGTVVYSYNPDLKMSPGTLTKLALALVVVENCDLDEVVTCAEGIQSKVPGGAQKLTPYLKSGEQLTVRDLLHGLILWAANDAAVALAEHVAGTTAACTALMNKRVKQLGCTNTEFGNISGLDTAVTTSTARDIAKIVVEGCKNEEFLEIFSATQYTIPATNMEEEREFYTKNYLMDNHVIQQFYDERVKGGIPSYTEASGAAIACVAEYNNMKLVCVSLGGSRTEDDSGKVTWYGNFDEILEIIKFVFNNFKINRIIYDGMTVQQWPVIGGESEAVGEAYVNVDTVVPAGAQMDNLIFDYTVESGSLSAPIKKGQRIATMQVIYRNCCLTEVELFAMADVKATADTGVTINSTAVKSDSGTSGVMSVVGTICVIILGIVGVYLVYNSYMRSRIRAQRRKRRAARRRSR